MKGTFFYNYTANKQNTYDKYRYGIFTIECDDEKNLVNEAFEEINKTAKEEFPTADNINLTAFNRV